MRPSIPIAPGHQRTSTSWTSRSRARHASSRSSRYRRTARPTDCGSVRTTCVRTVRARSRATRSSTRRTSAPDCASTTRAIRARWSRSRVSFPRPRAGSRSSSSMADYTREENLADSGALADLFARLDALPMPIIARIQGPAIGGGAGLVAIADIAVAVEAATFAFTEVRLGILPAVISPYVVRKVGASFATAAFTTGIRFDSHRAFETGLVHSVVDEGQLDPELGRFVDAILAGGPEAVNAAKRLVREVIGRTPAEVRDLTVTRIADAR